MRSRRLRVTLKRSAKKLSGRVRASSLIRHSAPSAVSRAPILSWACAYPQLFRGQKLAPDGGGPPPPPPPGPPNPRPALPPPAPPTRGPPDHRRRRDDPAVGPRLPAELDEDVTAAGDLDQLGDPADAGDERIVPLLEVDARAVGPHRRILPDLVHLVPHVLDEVNQIREYS